MYWIEIMLLVAYFLGSTIMVIGQAERIRAMGRLNDDILTMNRILQADLKDLNIELREQAARMPLEGTNGDHNAQT